MGDVTHTGSESMDGMWHGPRARWVADHPWIICDHGHAFDKMTAACGTDRSGRKIRICAIQQDARRLVECRKVHARIERLQVAHRYTEANRKRTGVFDIAHVMPPKGPNMYPICHAFCAGDHMRKLCGGGIVDLRVDGLVERVEIFGCARKQRAQRVRFCQWRKGGRRVHARCGQKDPDAGDACKLAPYSKLHHDPSRRSKIMRSPSGSRTKRSTSRNCMRSRLGSWFGSARITRNSAPYMPSMDQCAPFETVSSSVFQIMERRSCSPNRNTIPSKIMPSWLDRALISWSEAAESSHVPRSRRSPSRRTSSVIAWWTAWMRW